MQVAKGCWGSPLVLKLIGGSLRGQPFAVWKRMVNLLSEGRSIVDSNDELRKRLQKFLEDALKGNSNIKKCFMDLGLFFQDKKIPVAALIDIWIELNDLVDDDIDAMNIVHELDNLNLVNLVVARYICPLLTFILLIIVTLLNCHCDSLYHGGSQLSIVDCIAFIIITSIKKQKTLI